MIASEEKCVYNNALTMDLYGGLKQKCVAFVFVNTLSLIIKLKKGSIKLSILFDVGVGQRL